MESHFIIGLRLPGSPLDNDWIVLARTLRSSNNGKGMWRSIKQAFVERLWNTTPLKATTCEARIEQANFFAYLFHLKGVFSRMKTLIKTELPGATKAKTNVYDC